MRTHLEIISDVGGPDRLAEKLGVSIHTARSWRQRKSIPPEQWPAMVDLGVAEMDELVSARVAKRAGQDLPAQDAA